MKRNYFWHVWKMPLVLAVLSLVGLITALVGNGLMDALSWLTLVIPLAVTAGIQASGRRSRKSTDTGRGSSFKHHACLCILSFAEKTGYRGLLPRVEPAARLYSFASCFSTFRILL